MFSGYKTVLIGLLSMIAGLATAMGVTLDPETLSAIANNAETVVGGIVTLYGLVMIVLRKFTSSPMFKAAQTFKQR
jgi:hypothetical protein